MRKLLTILALSLLLGAPGSPLAAKEPKADSAETKAIREHTTSERHLTPLVDHLPDHTLPSPRDHFGYTIGTPGKLTKAADIHAYFRRLAKDSVRATVIPTGTSREGREMIVLAIADANGIRDLEANSTRLAHLGDPRILREVDDLLERARPAYWITAGLHSTELGPPETVTELAYRLIVSEDEMIRRIRSEIITLITPVLEVDGRERQVEWYRRHVAGYTNHHDMPRRSPPYWGHYTFHDNNRDGIMLTQPLTRNYLATYLRFRPTVSLDLHESVPLLYVSMGTGPYNPAIDPITQHEWQWLSAHEVTTLNRMGLPGVWTWGFYTGWAPSYLLWVTNLRNACGRFYETFGNGTAETLERRLTEASYAGKKVVTRQWYRGEPPPKTLRWSMRDNVNFMQSGVLVSLDFVARHGTEFLMNHRTKALKALQAGREKAPHAFTFQSEGVDQGRLRTLLDVLLRHGIEVHRFTEGSADYVVRMDQPWRGLVETLLGVQRFPEDADLAPYDDVGWTLGLMLGIEVTAVDDPKVLARKMRRVTAVPPPTGGILEAEDAKVALFDYWGERDMAPFRFALGGRKVLAAKERFEVGGLNRPAGSLLVPLESAEDAVAVAKIAERLGLIGQGLGGMPDVPTHEVDLPRVAVLTTWTRTQDTGWLRYTLDHFGIPYSLIAKERVRQGGLRRDFDAIVMASQGGWASLSSIISGIDPKWGPMAYTKTDEFPSHGVPISSPDITGGIGFPGLEEIRRFVAEGGLLVTLGSAGVLPVESGIVRGVWVDRPAAPLPGSVLRAKVRRPEHPLAWGYPEVTHLFRANLPGYRVRRYDERYVVMQFGTKDPYPADDEPEDHEEKEPKDPIVLSGGFRGFEVLDGAPAVLDVPVGSGRVVIIAPAVTRRFQDHHDYPLLWNALLHWNDMPAPDPADEKRKR
ncbi:MAG: M14 family zinc carboxypeptidase [Planctomycetota bacterium]|jgi:hypothetical protein